MQERDFWQMEESFWTGGAEHARSLMRDDAVFVFPYPAGIQRRDASLKGMDGNAPWRSVVMKNREFSRSGPVALLAYKAEAEREGDEIFEALCASTYVDDGDGWRLMSHQQTPCAETAAGA